MKTVTRPTRVLAAVLAFAFIAGCGSTPKDRVANAERSLSVALAGVNAAVDAGLVKDQTTALTLNAAVVEANAAVGDASHRVLSGQAIEADFYADRAASAVARLAMVLAQTQKGHQ